MALGSTGMRLSPIGFGAWAVGGGDWEHGWGPQDDAESVAAIERALELGINWIDTAAVYGFGHSEEVVGRALASRRERPFVFTKCGLVRGGDGREVPCLRRDSIRREVEASLDRLGVAAIDLHQIHWPFPEEEIEEGWAALVELREEGLIRHAGVSNFSVAQLRRVAAIAPVETLQPPFSLIDREAERELLPFCEEQGIGVIVYSPMGSGLLTGTMTRERIAGLAADDWRTRSPHFQEPLLTRNLALADNLNEIAARHGHTAGEAAIAWTLHNRAVTGAIVGVRSAEQVAGIRGALEFRLSETEVGELEHLAQSLG